MKQWERRVREDERKKEIWEREKERISFQVIIFGMIIAIIVFQTFLFPVSFSSWQRENEWVRERKKDCHVSQGNGFQNDERKRNLMKKVSCFINSNQMRKIRRERKGTSRERKEEGVRREERKVVRHKCSLTWTGKRVSFVRVTFRERMKWTFRLILRLLTRY